MINTYLPYTPMIFVNEDGEFDGIVSTLKEHALRKAKNSRYHFFLKNICIIQTKSCCPHINKCDQRSPLVYSIFYPGLFESLTQQLASALNFTSVRQLSFDGNWGGMFFNEQTQRMEWNGNIRMLMDNQSDMCAAGMTFLKERAEVEFVLHVDFVVHAFRIIFCLQGINFQSKV